MTTPPQFAPFVRARAQRLGYDLSSQRSGGKKQLAEDTGLSAATISRLLSGEVTPSADSLEPLAKALDVDLGLLLELAGVVSPGALTRGRDVAPRDLTPRQAARRLGITGARSVAVFEAVTEALLKDYAVTAPAA